MQHRTMWLLVAMLLVSGVLGGVARAAEAAVAPTNIVAEGERFQPQDAKGWKVTAQDDSYASMTFGGMWCSNGGLLGAPADSVDSVAKQSIIVPVAGSYRVWSKYQAPPYFNYLHKIEVIQNGKTLHSYVYGKRNAQRYWSFNPGYFKQLWWFWGVDHDALEGPPQMVKLEAGPAEIRLTTVKQDQPAGDPMVDFVFLTTAPEYKSVAPGGLYAIEAMQQNHLYLRFQNVASQAAQLTISRSGHYQPYGYGVDTKLLPEAVIGAGQWSGWVDIGGFCILAHDEGLFVNLPGATQAIPVQVALDPAGKEMVGDLKVVNGDAVVIPIGILWNKEHKVRSSREHAQQIIDLCKTKWRTANGGQKPKELLWYGAFNSRNDLVWPLKDALGYNTLLPDNFDHIKVDGYHQHCTSEAELRAFVATLKDKQSFKIMSFGDEIGLVGVNLDDSQYQSQFVAWLKDNKITKDDLGLNPDAAKLADRKGNVRIAWYAQLFNEYQSFLPYKKLTALTKELIGPQVETGANYSPHRHPMYYGDMAQWIEIFKQNGMTMYWAEDYLFGMPQPPQLVSWMLATVRCAIKYNNQKFHMYIMPHSPGQLPKYFRHGAALSIGNGAHSIDNFWVAPAETFTENFVAWDYPEMFQAVHESIYDSAEAEPFQRTGKVRPARVAIILSKATDYNEARAQFDVKKDDPFTAMCDNAENRPQILGRTDQQMLYLALKHGQQAVDLITEDDIVDGILKNYDVAYFAGEWVMDRAVPKMEQWVKDGGVLYLCAGLGHRNQFNEEYSGLLKLAGLTSATLEKNLYVIRTYLELPLAQPIDTITMGERKLPAIGMKQELTLANDAQVKVLAQWSNGKPAITVRELGKGKCFAIGTLAGNSAIKTALHVTPLARGGRKMVYNPTDYSDAAMRLVLLPFAAKQVEQQVVCSNPNVEAVAMDGPQGTLLTLVNWDNQPVKNLTVTIKMPANPRGVRSVAQQKNVETKFENGVLTIKTELDASDYLLLPK